MNSFMFGALAGVAGGADKYTQLQDEERQYNLENKKAQQDMQRKEHFEKFKYNMQDSSLVRESGEAVSKGELEAMSELEKGALQSEKEYDVDVEASALAGAQDASKGDKLSQWYSKDGRQLTNKEATDAQGAGEELTTKYKMAEKTAETKAGVDTAKALKLKNSKIAAEEIKEKGNNVKSFRSALGKAVAEAQTPEEKTMAISNVATAYQSKEVLNEPQVKKALVISQTAQVIGDMQHKGAQKADIESYLKEKYGKKISDEGELAVAVRETIDFAKYAGYFKMATGPDRIFGYKGDID